MRENVGKENRKTLSETVLRGFSCCTQKTICFRTSLWRIWEEYIVSESTFHHLMMSYKDNFPHLGKV